MKKYILISLLLLIFLASASASQRAFLTYEEGSGTTSVDITGNGHNAIWTYNNASFTTDSMFGVYSLFMNGSANGSTGYEVTYQTTPIRNLAQGTVDLWVKLNITYNSGQNVILLINDNPGVANYVQLYVGGVTTDTGVVHFAKKNGGIDIKSSGAQAGGVTSYQNITVNDSNWHHIQVSWDGVSNYLIIDGNLSSSVLETGGTDDVAFPNIQYSQPNNAVKIDNFQITTDVYNTSQVATSGTLFSTAESVSACGFTNATPLILCTISNSSFTKACTTSLSGAGLENVKIKVNPTSRNDIPAGVVPFYSTSGNYAVGLFLRNISAPITTASGQHILVYNFPTILSDVNQTSINFTMNPFWTDSGVQQFGLPTNSSIGENLDCTSFSASPLVTNVEFDRLFPYNSTHWLNRTMQCVGNTSTSITGLTANSLTGSTTPWTINNGTNQITLNAFSFLYINQSSGTHFVPMSALWLNVTLRYIKTNRGTAICSVGDLASGTYNYSCDLSATPTLKGQKGETFPNGSVNIVNTNTTIAVSLIRTRALALEIDMLDFDFNPVVGATCSASNLQTVTSSITAPHSIYGSTTYGSCLMNGVTPNTTQSVTINPNNGKTKPLNMSFPIGDYYNSQRFGVLTNNYCQLFDGIYDYAVNIDTFQPGNISDVVRFHAFDLSNPDKPPVQYAVFVYDSGLQCTTGADGFCTIPGIVPDVLKHTWSVSKRPYYSDQNGTFFHSETPISVGLYHNNSDATINPHLVNPKTGGTSGTGNDPLQFWLAFLLSPVSIIFLVLSYISFKVGQSTIGILFTVLFFIQLLPFWFAIIITVFIVLMMSKTTREIVMGGAGAVVEEVRNR